MSSSRGWAAHEGTTIMAVASDPSGIGPRQTSVILGTTIDLELAVVTYVARLYTSRNSKGKDAKT